MKDKRPTIYLIFIFIFTILYGITILTDQSVFSNYLSFIPVLLTGIVLLKFISKDNEFKKCWDALAFGTFAWALGDIVWLICENFLNMDPQENYFIMFLYLLTNLSLLYSALVYFSKNMKKWHRVQLLVDSIAVIALVALTLLDSLVSKIDLSSFHWIYHFFNFSYAITDAVALSILFIMIASARNQRFISAMNWVSAGYITFILTDLSNIYTAYIDAYTPNSLTDLIFVISIMFFAVGTLSLSSANNELSSVEYINKPNNMGSPYRVLFLIIIPLIMFAFGMLSLVTIIHSIFVLLLHQILSNYIQIAIRNEQLLLQERSMITNLESLVQARTVELSDANKSLEVLSIRDALTNLYNRRFIFDKMDDLIKSSSFDFTVYYMDLDHFKIINDLHGHDMGDQVLYVISKKFHPLQDHDFWISRVGGDEFTIVQLHRPSFDKKIVEEFCAKLLQIFTEPIIIDQYQFNVGVSIGISRYPYDSTERECLVKYADSAMYQAKKNHGNHKCVFYNPNQGSNIERRGKIEMLLKTVVYDQTFDLHFQPQFSLPDRSLIGIEALLRWQHAELGFISPGEFIPIAEESDTIIDLGKWVIRKAFEFIRKWNAQNPNPIKIGINLSPLQFDSIDFFPFIQSMMLQYEVKPEWIDFEVTETSAMNSSTLMEEVFGALAGLGVQISIDDFGTGYSSLSYIKRFDIDQLKIAKELVDPIGSYEDERLILKAIIMMAKGMGLKTIAEGVERADQLDILQELGCDAIQGYYLSKPLPADLLYEKYYFKSDKTSC